MPRWLLLLATLLAVASCERARVLQPTRPATPAPPASFTRYVQGTVSDPLWASGRVICGAEVWLAGDHAHAVRSDSAGWFALPIDYIGGESLTVVASKPVGAGSWSGSRKFVIDEHGGAIVSIVLDRWSNF